MSEPLELSGLDGSNLLGFLAALGTFITLSESTEFEDVRLEWTLSDGWRPRLLTSKPADREAVVAVLASRLSKPEAAQAFEIPMASSVLAEDLTIEPADYRAHTSKAATSNDRRLADFANAFGSESVSASNGYIADTAFRTMSGAGHQHFLGSMRELVSCTETSHFEAALFSPWKYEDDRPTMRWDPEDDRRYALRWREPSGDKIRTVRGANRLAIEGLRFFPVVSVGRQAMTTGFRGKGASDTVFTWPMWEVPLRPDPVRSLVASAALQAAGRSDKGSTRMLLRRQGVVEIFQSRRLTLGKYRSFSPARPA
jgi:hypothetical protein